MTTRGWEVTPPSAVRAAQPTLRAADRWQAWSLVQPTGSLGCLSQGLGPLCHVPALSTQRVPFCQCSLRDFGETGWPFCVSDGSSVTWSCLPGHLPTGVKAKESGHVPGASARGEEGPWRSSKGITARGTCLVPRHCPLTNGEGGRCCHMSFSTMKRKPCNVL